MRWFHRIADGVWVSGPGPGCCGLIGFGMLLVAYAIVWSAWHGLQDRRAARIESRCRERYGDTSLGTVRRDERDPYTEETRPGSVHFLDFPEAADISSGNGDRFDDQGILWQRQGRSRYWFAETILGHKVHIPNYALWCFSELQLLYRARLRERIRVREGDVGRDRLAWLNHEIERVAQRGSQRFFIVKQPLVQGGASDSEWVYGRFNQLSHEPYADQYGWAELPRGLREVEAAYVSGERPGLLGTLQLYVPRHLSDTTPPRFGPPVCVSPGEKWIAVRLSGGGHLRYWIGVMACGETRRPHRLARVVETQEPIHWHAWLEDGRLIYGYGHHAEVRAVDSARFPGR